MGRLERYSSQWNWLNKTIENPRKQDPLEPFLCTSSFIKKIKRAAWYTDFGSYNCFNKSLLCSVSLYRLPVMHDGNNYENNSEYGVQTRSRNVYSPNPVEKRKNLRTQLQCVLKNINIIYSRMKITQKQQQQFIQQHEVPESVFTRSPRCEGARCRWSTQCVTVWHAPRSPSSSCWRPRGRFRRSTGCSAWGECPTPEDKNCPVQLWKQFQKIHYTTTISPYPKHVRISRPKIKKDYPPGH